jgi:hypothetical protein
MDAGVAAGFSHLAARENIRTMLFLFSSRAASEKPAAASGCAAQGRLRRCRSFPMHPASPSSRRLASDPAALATPPHTLFQQTAGLSFPPSVPHSSEFVLARFATRGN